MNPSTPDRERRIRVGRALDDPATKRELNERIFTTIAHEYPWMTAVLSFGRDAAWKRRLIDSLPDVRSPVCVDLACGTGDLARRLARRFPSGRVVAQDLTPAMLDEARRRTVEPNVCYERRDIADTGLGDASIDLVTGGYALRNAPDLDEAISETARILRPGGRAAFLDFVRWPGRLGGRVELALLQAWGGFWGLVLHANPAVYGYIAASLRSFPTVAGLADRFHSHGLEAVRTVPCFFGFTAILTFRKPGGARGAGA
jgi:demethylmenaquinone methyltransferase/2-methoxy-6-polyprenyl-1,4-benzoquinol methylase